MPTVKRTSLEEDMEEIVEEAVKARTKEAKVAGTTATTKAALEESEGASVDHSTQAQHSLTVQESNHSTPANNFIKVHNNDGTFNPFLGEVVISNEYVKPSPPNNHLKPKIIVTNTRKQSRYSYYGGNNK